MGVGGRRVGAGQLKEILDKKGRRKKSYTSKNVVLLVKKILASTNAENNSYSEEIAQPSLPLSPPVQK